MQSMIKIINYYLLMDEEIVRSLLRNRECNDSIKI